MANITIVGTGLIGTSLGLALKSSKMPDITITGHDREPLAGKTAHKLGAVDAIEWSIVKSVREADMVIIATPVLAIKEAMEQIAGVLPQECVVTDTGSTKRQVLEWAEALLPAHVSFVGGHPLAGKEESGPDAAKADLFQGASYCIVPGRRAAAWAVQAVVSMVEAIGAKPYFIDSMEHDNYMAAVSHLPIALSAALVASTTRSPSWHEMARLAATGYRDISRLASGDPQMNRDIHLTNREEIGLWVDRVIGELLELRRILNVGDEEGLARFFAHVYEEREKWVAGAPLGPAAASGAQVPGAAEQMSSIFLGDLLAQKSRDLLRQYEKDRPDAKKRRWR